MSWYAGDVGTEIHLNIGEDISSATAVYILLGPPSGEVKKVTASKSGDNLGIYYKTVADDIPETMSGDWTFQGLLYFGTDRWRTTKVTQEVLAPLIEGHLVLAEFGEE